MRPLEQTQRECISALLMPWRGRSRASTALAPVAEGHSPEFLAKAEELMKRGVNLSPAESLELYHRQYWFRLLDSIAEDFPILQKVAGEETFFHAQAQTGGVPVADDLNARLEMVMFQESDD